MMNKDAAYALALRLILSGMRTVTVVSATEDDAKELLEAVMEASRIIPVVYTAAWPDKPKEDGDGR